MTTGIGGDSGVLECHPRQTIVDQDKLDALRRLPHCCDAVGLRILSAHCTDQACISGQGFAENAGPDQLQSVSGLALSNVANNFDLIIDFGEPCDFNTVALARTNLTRDAQIRIMASDTLGPIVNPTASTQFFDSSSQANAASNFGLYQGYNSTNSSPWPYCQSLPQSNLVGAVVNDLSDQNPFLVFPDPIVGDFMFSTQVTSMTSGFLGTIGLSTSPGTATGYPYFGFEHGFRLFGSTTNPIGPYSRVFDSGALVTGVQYFQVGDVFSIDRIGGVLTYRRNGFPIYSLTDNRTFYLQTSNPTIVNPTWSGGQVEFDATEICLSDGSNSFDFDNGDCQYTQQEIDQDGWLFVSTPYLLFNEDLEKCIDLWDGCYLPDAVWTDIECAKPLKARYIRLQIVDPNVENIRAQRLFSGLPWDGACGVSLGWGLKVNDSSETKRTICGQRVKGCGYRYREFTGQFNNSEDEILKHFFASQFFEGTNSEFYVIPEPDRYYNAHLLNFWGVIKETTQFTRARAGRWSTPINFEEVHAHR